MVPEPIGIAAERSPGAFRDEVDAEMIRGLYRRVKPLMFANFGAMILLTAALWGSTERTLLLSWAIALGGWTLLRFGLARLYMRRPRPLEETRRWTLAFAAGAGIAGCLWGTSVFLIDGLASDSAKLITAFIMAALSAAAIAGYTNSLLAFAGFVVPALLPYSLRLVYLDGGFSPAIAVFVVFWGLLLWMMARHLNEGFRESLELGLRNGRLAERLMVERDRAEAASIAKTRFLGNISHELRTPLNAILGYSEMMRQEMLGPIGNEKYTEYVADIHDSGGHLLALVEQMLDVTKIESGNIEISEERLCVEEILAAVFHALQPQAEAEGLRFELDSPVELPRLCADGTKLRQMLQNLATNAFKFTPEGGRVAISAALRDEGGVTFSVTDSGIGIAPEDIALVQIPFAQLEKREHTKRAEALKNQGGHTSTGLGLPLVKLLAEAHGATFELTSELGVGTTANIHFPVDRSLAETENQEREPAPARAYA